MSVNELKQKDTALNEEVKPHFDEFGRCIPSSLIAKAHVASRRYFLVEQPRVNYQEIYDRINSRFEISRDLSVSEFQQRAEAILMSLKKDENNSNITQGVAVPFILPKAEYDDIGQTLEKHYLPSVEQSFKDSFPKYSFDNHCVDSLQGKLSVAKASRHDDLLAAMKKGVVVGWYFPALLEYSVPAAIEQVQRLPKQFLLAGGFDTAAAFIGSPDLLLRKDGYPPLFWLSGLESEKEGIGYHFEAYGYNLTFNRRAHLDNVAEYWASGLVVLG
jgi:hypothetical protein